jgi:hypothetical protein
MTFKVCTLALVLALFGINAKAQAVKWSLPLHTNEHALITECLGQNNYGLFLIKRNSRQQDRSITLEHYDGSLRQLGAKTFLTKKDEYYLKFILQPEQILLLYATPDKDGKQILVKLKHINFGLNQDGNDTTLFSIDAQDILSTRLMATKNRQSNYTLITYTTQKAEFPNAYQYMMLDSSCNRSSSGEFTIDVNAKYSIEQAAYTQDHIALLVRQDAKKKASRLEYQYFIFDGAIGDNTFRKTALQTDSNEVTEGILKTDYKNHSFVFAGLFSLRDSNYIKGYCLWKRDTRGGKSSLIFRKFNDAVVSDMSGKRSRIKGISNLREGDIVLRGDGGVIITSEEYQETRESVMEMNMYGMAQPSYRYYYYYENVLVLSIGASGSLDWHTTIHKDQISVNDNGIYSSYLLTILPDRLVYVYNDLSRKDWNLSIVQVNNKGEVKNDILVRGADVDGHLIPQYGDQIAYNELLIPCQERRGQTLLKVSF